MIHQITGECHGCKDKLLGVHIALFDWFYWLKEEYPQIHISCGFRGEKEQNEVFAAGKSRLKWPRSMHNKTLDDIPCSQAIDLFRIDEFGKAHFEEALYREIIEKTLREGYPIEWGGNFVTLKDFVHFQLIHP